MHTVPSTLYDLIFFLSWEEIHNAHLGYFLFLLWRTLSSVSATLSFVPLPEHGLNRDYREAKVRPCPSASPIVLQEKNISLFNAMTPVQNTSVCWAVSWEDLLREWSFLYMSIAFSSQVNRSPLFKENLHLRTDTYLGIGPSLGGSNPLYACQNPKRFLCNVL